MTWLDKIPRFIYSIWAYLIFFFVLFIGFWGYLLVAILVRHKVERRLLRINNFIAWLWAMLTGMRYELELHPEVQDDRAYIFTPNHTSSLDMMIASYALRYGMRFLAKEELRRVPLMGFMFGRISVFVNRGSKDSRQAALQAMKPILHQGMSLCIFPEGTRNRTSEPLSGFHDGAFRLAIATDVPIVPLVLLGARDLLPMDSWLMRPGKMRAVYLAPVSSSGMTEEDLPALRDKVFRLMYNKVVEEEPGFQHFRPLPERTATSGE